MKSEDIARLAGVSRGTVSRVINGKSDVSSATRKRIQEIIKEHNYVPDQSARKLVGKIPQVLGLFVRERIRSSEDNLIPRNNYKIPYLGDLILVIINQAKQCGYRVMVTVVSENTDFDDMVTLFHAKMIAGGIFLGFPEQVAQIEQIIAEEYPVALVDQKRVDSRINVILSNIDDFAGGYKATKYLIEQGHSHIAHVCGNLRIVSAQLRKEGYMQCMKDHNLPIQDEYMAEGGYDEHQAYEVTQKLFNKDVLRKQQPTAIFFASDVMAVGGWHALKDLNLQIPEDVSCIGYDGYPVEGFIGKRLTSIQGSLENLGTVSVQLLTKYIENKGELPAHIEEPNLIEGDTVIPYQKM